MVEGYEFNSSGESFLLREFREVSAFHGELALPFFTKWSSKHLPTGSAGVPKFFYDAQTDALLPFVRFEVFRAALSTRK